jgi:hypothetical protein
MNLCVKGFLYTEILPDLRKVSPLFTNCREGVFSETESPLLFELLGNSEGLGFRFLSPHLLVISDIINSAIKP